MVKLRRATLAVVIIAVAGTAFGVWHATASDGPSKYSSVRQSRVQEVPGTFGLTLRPPPADFDPAISPIQAVQIASQGRKVPGPVYVTLASVPGMYTGAAVDRPMWLVVERNLCYPSQKGELVSSSRRAPKDRASNCSPRNLWIQVLNPLTGVRLSVESGFDSTANWIPATGAG
jgi:hypothetical protein